MKTLINSITFALCAFTLHAAPREFNLEVPPDMAGHTFSLYQYDPADPANPATTTPFVPSFWNNDTGRLSLVATVEDENRQFFIQNLTIGGQIDGAPYTGSFMAATSEGFSANGNNIFTYWLSSEDQDDTLGLLFDTTASGGGIWAFPMSGMTTLDFWEVWGFMNFWFDTGIPRATYTGTATLLNLTAQTYLDSSNNWQPFTGALPTVAVSVFVGWTTPVSETFTLHTQGRSTQTVTPATALVSGQVGSFEEFWLTRDSDGKISPAAVAFSSQGTLDWSSSFDTPPANWVTTPFLIGQEFASHPIKVVHPSGVEQWLEPDPAFPLPDTISATSPSYKAYHFRATVDMSQAWALVDTTTNANLGCRTSVMDGLYNWLPAPPVSSITVSLPASRDSSEFSFVDANGQATYWQDTFQSGSYNYDFQGWTFPIDYKVGIMTLTGNGSYRLVDHVTGRGQIVDTSTSSVNAETWTLPTAVSLQLPASRWTHDLWIVSPGHAEKIQPVSMQGLWVFTGNLAYYNEAAVFAPFNTFIGTATAYDGSWIVVDMTTGELAPQASGTDLGSWSTASDQWDYDSDGLYDWYEFLIGTNHMMADTDSDGVNDSAELATGTNPRAQTLTVAAASSLQIFTPLE